MQTQRRQTMDMSPRSGNKLNDVFNLTNNVSQTQFKIRSSEVIVRGGNTNHVNIDAIPSELHLSRQTPRLSKKTTSSKVALERKQGLTGGAKAKGRDGASTLGAVGGSSRLTNPNSIKHEKKAKSQLGKDKLEATKPTFDMNNIFRSLAEVNGQFNEFRLKANQELEKIFLKQNTPKPAAKQKSMSNSHCFSTEQGDGARQTNYLSFQVTTANSAGAANGSGQYVSALQGGAQQDENTLPRINHAQALKELEIKANLVEILNQVSANQEIHFSVAQHALQMQQASYAGAPLSAE